MTEIIHLRLFVIHENPADINDSKSRLFFSSSLEMFEFRIFEQKKLCKYQNFMICRCESPGFIVG